MFERLIHLPTGRAVRGNRGRPAVAPPSPQGLIFESKYIFRAVLEEDRGSQVRQVEEEMGRKSQDEENCAKQARASLIQRK